MPKTGHTRRTSRDDTDASARSRGTITQTLDPDVGWDDSAAGTWNAGSDGAADTSHVECIWNGAKSRDGLYLTVTSDDEYIARGQGPRRLETYHLNEGSADDDANERRYWKQKASQRRAPTAKTANQRRSAKASKSRSKTQSGRNIQPSV